MFQYHCLNPIAKKGLDCFSDRYRPSDTLENADAVLVRSAQMLELELPVSVLAVAVCFARQC